MKEITIEDIQNILEYYNKTKGIRRSIFGDSDELIKIKNFVKSAQDGDIENDIHENRKRKLNSQELIEFYRLLIDIKIRENTKSSETIIKLLELFYPEMAKPRTKTREYSSDTYFESIFRTLDKFNFFSDSNHFINLCDYIVNNNKGWRLFYFNFQCEFALLNSDIPLNNPIDILHYYSSIDKKVNLEDYYYEIVRSLWMLKQLNMLTPKNLNILKNICEPKTNEISYLSNLIDICAMTHEDLLFTKWHYEKFIKADEKEGIDYIHYSLSLDWIKKTRKTWLVRLFDAYKLLIESQKNPDKDLSKFVDFFASSQEQQNKNDYFYSDSQRDMVKRYSDPIKTLSNNQLLTPSLVLIILSHSDPNLLLKLLTQLNKKELSEPELYCLNNFKYTSAKDEELVALFNKDLEKQEVIKNSRVLFQAYGNDQDNLFTVLPKEILIRITQLSATDLDEKEATRLAIRNFNKPLNK